MAYVSVNVGLVRAKFDIALKLPILIIEMLGNGIISEVFSTRKRSCTQRTF